MVKPILLSKILPNLNLDITSSNSDSFNVIHWQCEANIKTENDALIIEDTEFENKALNFIKLAKKQNSSIVLTPEYSFPWKLLDNIIADSSLHPTEGKLWCLCMQYISLNDFDKWCNNHNSVKVNKNSKVNLSFGEPYIVVFDEFIEIKRFANILVYLFIKDSKLIVLMQSKLEHMQDSLYEFESEGLSFGKTIFLFNGKSKSDNVFCSLICADGLVNNHYDEITKHSAKKHVFLFHPQCNQKPYHDSLITLIDSHLNSNWHFLRLNWARNTCINSKSLNELGTDYIYKESDNVEDYWKKENFGECYIKNRLNGLNLLMDNNRKCQWTFSHKEHVASYYIKNPVFSSTAATAKHEFLVKKTYIYDETNQEWSSDESCPFELFEKMLPDVIPEFMEKLKAELSYEHCDRCEHCDGSRLCPLILWDRFISLCKGKREHEIFFRSPDKYYYNSSPTNFSNKNIEKLIKNEFIWINKMEKYLKDIVSHSQNSENENIQTLQHWSPGGMCFCIDKNFPQNAKTMLNVKSNVSNMYSASHEGLAVYTKNTLNSDLKSELDKYSKNTAASLGVLLFYPDGECTVKLFPNPRWKRSTETGPKGTRSTNISDIGIGGVSND